ncbi:hypothetical protein Bca4012_008226 [Brassica carinata]|uniref:(rape) hypothetical protein n=1 Tax=Brassica napus TaxID=3708 RepID=A0A816IQB5_BRANA|nr:unnamed protein product [Brassica napus]
MLALIDDGCFWCLVLLCWRFVRSSILFVFQKLVVVETLLICERMLIIRLSVYGYTSSAFKFQKLVLVLFSFLVCVICKCCLLVTFLVQLSLMDVEEEAVIGT